MLDQWELEMAMFENEAKEWEREDVGERGVVHEAREGK